MAILDDADLAELLDLVEALAASGSDDQRERGQRILDRCRPLAAVAEDTALRFGNWGAASARIDSITIDGVRVHLSPVYMPPSVGRAIDVSGLSDEAGGREGGEG